MPLLPLLLLAQLEFPGTMPVEPLPEAEIIRLPGPDSAVLCHVTGIFSDSGQPVLLFDPIGKDAYDPNKGQIPAPLWSYCHKGSFF